jgi:hypothetical protein
MECSAKNRMHGIWSLEHNVILYMECSVRSDWYVVHGMFCMKIGALNVVLGRQWTGCGV